MDVPEGGDAQSGQATLGCGEKPHIDDVCRCRRQHDHHRRDREIAIDQTRVWPARRLQRIVGDALDDDRDDDTAGRGEQGEEKRDERAGAQLGREVESALDGLPGPGLVLGCRKRGHRFTASRSAASRAYAVTRS